MQVKVQVGSAVLSGFVSKADAACETSSNPANNGGYCVPLYDGGGDACVQNSAADAVRCNGNT